MREVKASAACGALVCARHDRVYRALRGEPLIVPHNAAELSRAVRMERPVERGKPADHGPAEQQIEQREQQYRAAFRPVGENRGQKINRDESARRKHFERHLQHGLPLRIEARTIAPRK